MRPTIVYNDRMRIELGGKVVELVHPGLNHSDDATVMVFPGERAAFATEFIVDALVAGNPRSLPSACGPFDGSPLDEWIKSYRSRRGPRVRRAGSGPRLRAGRQDAGARNARVLRRFARPGRGRHGRRPTLEQLKDSVKLERYKNWANYEQLRAYNVEAAYRNLLTYR